MGLLFRAMRREDKYQRNDQFKFTGFGGQKTWTHQLGGGRVGSGLYLSVTVNGLVFIFYHLDHICECFLPWCKVKLQVPCWTRGPPRAPPSTDRDYKCICDVHHWGRRYVSLGNISQNAVWIELLNEKRFFLFWWQISICISFHSKCPNGTEQRTATVCFSGILS